MSESGFQAFVSERKCSVYVHLNKINRKAYVGQTSVGVSRRWRKDGNRYKTQAYFYNAIKKYGWDGFDHIVVADNLTNKEADKLEIMLIDIFKSTDRKHGYNISAGGRGVSSHHKSKTRLYKQWNKMKERCYTPSCEAYKQNGALGVKVCDEWLNDFGAFFKWALENGYDDNLLIFRKNKEKDYTPHNCYWTTPKEKAIRRDTTLMFMYDGMLRTIEELSDISGIAKGTLYTRLVKSHMSLDEAMKKPVQSKIMISYNGEKHSLHAWSKITGISYKTIQGRYDKGWSLDKIFDKRKYNRNGVPIVNQEVVTCQQNKSENQLLTGCSTLPGMTATGMISSTGGGSAGTMTAQAQ